MRCHLSKNCTFNGIHELSSSLCSRWKLLMKQKKGNNSDFNYYHCGFENRNDEVGE